MLWLLFKRFLHKDNMILICCIIVYSICNFFDITCLFYKIIEKPCPTCCMSRALLALLRGDFNAYFQYNAMAFPVMVVFLIELYSRHLNKYKCVMHCVCAFVLLVNFVYYLLRNAKILLM